MNCYNKVKSNHFQQSKMESNSFPAETLRKILFSKCPNHSQFKNPPPPFFFYLKKMPDVQKFSKWKTDLLIFRKLNCGV